MKKALAIACSIGLLACSGETGESIDSTSRSLASGEVEYAFAVRDVDRGQPGGDKGKEFVVDRIASDGTVQTEVIARTTEGGARVSDLVPGGTEIRGFKTLPGLTAGILAGEVTSIDEETELVEEAFRFNAGFFGVEKTGQSQDLGFPGDEGEASAKSLNPDEILFIDIGPMLGVIVDEGEDCRVGLRLFTDVVDGETMLTSATLDLKATSRDDDGICDGAALVLSSGSIMVDDVIEFSGDGSGVEISLEAVCPCWESLEALQATWVGFGLGPGDCIQDTCLDEAGDLPGRSNASLAVCTADGSLYRTRVGTSIDKRFLSCLTDGGTLFESVSLTPAKYERCNEVHDAFTASTVFSSPGEIATEPDNVDRTCGLPTPSDPCASFDCNDGDECTIDTCDPDVGCVNEAISCDDGDACTADTCVSGTGCINDSISCDDSNVCTADSCDPDVGCINETTLTECPEPPACYENVFATCDPGLGCPTQELTSDGLCGTACDFRGTGDPSGFQSECERICGPSGFICSQDPDGTLASCLAGDPVACESVDETGASFGCNVCTSPGAQCIDEVCNGTGCSTVTDDSLCGDDGFACTVETCDPVAGCVSTPDDSLCPAGQRCRLFEGCIEPPTCPCWDGGPQSVPGVTSITDVWVQFGPDVCLPTFGDDRCIDGLYSDGTTLSQAQCSDGITPGAFQSTARDFGNPGQPVPFCSVSGRGISVFVGPLTPDEYETCLTEHDEEITLGSSVPESVAEIIFTEECGLGEF